MRQDDRHGLSPVIVALRVGLHILFIGLLGFVLVMAIVAPTASSPAVLLVGMLMGVSWLAGTAIHTIRSSKARRSARLAWIALLLLQWATLVWLSPHAAYLVFPLCFLILEAMPGALGVAVVAVATIAVVLALGLHTGWSIGGVIGPVVAAIIAVGLGAGYRALAAEARAHERLYLELEATQSHLAATQRSAGASAERERLAREIHDTVAQSLSSITLLLHAAERADPSGPGVEHLRLARRSAGDALAEARRLIRDLSPAPLEVASLTGALRELGDRSATAGGIAVAILVADDLDLPMEHQAALLRIAQGTLANTVTHADARSATVEVVMDAASVRMTVSDDGRGFAPRTTSSNAAHGSFGLRSVRERIEQLDGALRIDSAPGAGTTITVELPLPATVPA
jgi:signal transduction histidine kinase